MSHRFIGNSKTSSTTGSCTSLPVGLLEREFTVSDGEVPLGKLANRMSLANFKMKCNSLFYMSVLILALFAFSYFSNAYCYVNFNEIDCLH